MKICIRNLFKSKHATPSCLRVPLVLAFRRNNNNSSSKTSYNASWCPINSGSHHLLSIPAMSALKVKGLTTVLKSRKNSLQAIREESSLNGSMPEKRICLEKPLNILVYVDDDVLFEQKRLEHQQPFISNVSGVAHHKISNPGFAEITTLWISTQSTVFKSIKRHLLQMVGFERFTIYPITYDEIKCKPWQHTTALLICVINSRKYKEEDEFLIKAEKALKEYITSDGRVVIYKLDELWENGDYIIGGESGLLTNVFKQRLILKCGKEFFAGPNGYVPNKDGRVIKFEDEDFEIVPYKPTIAHLITSDADLIDHQFVDKVNSNSRCLVQLFHTHQIPEEPYTRLPVIVNSDIKSIRASSFNFDVYYSNLTSSRFGQHVIFADTTTTTMSLAEPFTQFDGLVAIAGRQTEGKGRGENQWISPEGCLSYTVHVTVSLASNLGQRLGFVQHLASLSMIKAIVNSPGYEHLNLRLKWPNDIYWGEDIKVGGNIVTSRLEGYNVHCFLGCGLNVDNKYPTCSVNHIIQNTADPQTGQTPSNLPPLSKEKIVARALSELDILIKQFQREGLQSVKEEYLKYWLHSGKCVRMANTKEVIIKGLDDQGYLLVKDVCSGLLLSVLPDGNRFDMLNNLLVRKV